MLPSLPVKASDSSIEVLDAPGRIRLPSSCLADLQSRLHSLPEKATNVKSLWFCPLLGLALLGGGAAEEAKKPVRVYTNEDLDRLSPYRDQTGVFSEPAAETPRPAST